MFFKRLFDIVASFCGLLLIWWVFPLVAFLIKRKMPGGPAFFCQKRVGRNGELFTCHKFRSMVVAHNGSSVSVSGDSRITPFGAKLRHYKIDELPELWDVLIGNMSFVGPRPDVPGYADKLEGDDRDVLKLRPGITGPATLKYRLEDEMLEKFVAEIKTKTGKTSSIDCDSSSSSANSMSECSNSDLARQPQNHQTVCNANSQSTEDKIPSLTLKNLSVKLPEDIGSMSDQELAVWYNDNVIYPDKVRLNCYYYRHYSFMKDLQMIFATVLGFKVRFANEMV